MATIIQGSADSTFGGTIESTGIDDNATSTAITINSDESVDFANGIDVTGTVTQTTAKTKSFTGSYDGTTTGDITLGSLGFKPQSLFCLFSVNSSPKASIGQAARDGGQMVLLDYTYQAGSDYSWESSTSYFARLAHGTAKFSNLLISSWNADSVVITKDINNGGDSSTCAYKIIVMG